MKKGKGLRRIAACLAVLSLAAGVLTVPQTMTGTAQAITQSEINAKKDELSGVSSQIKDLEDQLSGIRDDKAQALEQKRLLDDQISLISQQIAETDEIIAQYDELIAAKEAEIAEIEAKEQAQYELFCKQVRSREEQGSVSYLSILFDSSDFSDLLDRAMMISEIMDYNNDLITMLLDTRDQLQTAKGELEGQRAEQQELRDQQAESKAALETRQAEAAQLVEKIQSQENEYAGLLDEVEAEKESIQNEILRMSAELARQQEEERRRAEEARRAAEAARNASNNQTSSSSSSETASSNAALGGYIWPVSSHKVNSGFGPRRTGIKGASTNHKGIDIGGVYYNTQVHAAKAGTVIISERSSSYGNYVVISHGSGNTTLYAHMSSRSVSAGDKVAQGDVIGITGSTGISSGPHLHFEITENGVRIDPMKYLG